MLLGMQGRPLTRRLAALATTLVVLGALLWSPQAALGSRWENHVDASLIREILYRDGELFMATGGGILVYTLSTGQFQQYLNTAGLPSNALTCLEFDGSGDLWVGTQDVGVVRVSLRGDAMDVRTFSPLDFPGPYITSLDLWDGEIVYGTTAGAGKFDGGFPSVKFLERHGLPSELVNDVLADGDVVWFATEEGTAVLDRLGFITPVSDGPPVARVIEKTGDAIWVGTDDGVWRMALTDSGWTQTGPTGISIYSLHWDGQTLWAGGTYAFYDYDDVGQGWTAHEVRSLYGPYGMPGAGTNGQVLAFTTVPGGDIYLGATTKTFRHGINLVRYDGQLENLIPNGPGENRIERLSFDVDGSVWVSCRGFGVGKLTPSGVWINYNNSIADAERLSNLFANLALLADSQGRKWFSTQTVNEEFPKPLDELDDKLDAVYANDVWTRHQLGSGGGDGYSTLRPQRAMEDPAGNRWFLADEADPHYPVPAAEWRGIHILSRDKSEWLKVQPETTNQQMKGGNVIHAAFGDGVAYVVIRNYGVQSWEVGGYDWDSLKDLSNQTWGDKLDAKLGIQLDEAGDATSVALRSDGVVWIGTNAGVYKYDRNVYPYYSHIRVKTGNEVGLLDRAVSFVLLDHQENLWVATTKGLNRIARDDDDDIEAYTTTAAYQELTGIPVPYPPSVVSDLAGENCTELLLHPTRDVLYVATYGGLSIFDISPPPKQPTDLANVYLYPNPVDGSKGHDRLMIDHVDAPVSIEVYNLEGNLVHSQSAAESGDVVWDLTGNAGFIVASGVYFVRVDNGLGAVVIPVTVVR